MTLGHASLSIVIPAYNEAGKIAADVAAAVDFLVVQGRPGEVIVVDDCSRDDTAAVAEAAGRGLARPVRAIRHETNQGKGGAVRTGVLASTGELVLMADAGLCIPFADAIPGITMITGHQCEIAHGSRRLAPNAIVRGAPALRRLLSLVFRTVAPFLVGAARGFTDTQCGFKLYRGDVARRLYADARCRGWLFDLDIIALAVRHGARIREFPVTWRCDRDSRVRPFRDVAKFAAEARLLRQHQASMRREDLPCPTSPHPASP